MMESEVRELGTNQIVSQTLKAAMRELQRKVDMGHEVPMKEFTDLLIWAKETVGAEFAAQIEKDKREGWEIVEHKWCGVPVKDFELPSAGIYKKH